MKPYTIDEICCGESRFEEVWAAAGTPHSVRRLRVSDLAEIVGGGFVDLAK